MFGDVLRRSIDYGSFYFFLRPPVSSVERSGSSGFAESSPEEEAAFEQETKLEAGSSRRVCASLG